MPTQARSAYGTQLLRGATVVPEIRNISPVGFAARMADVSAHDGNGWGSSIKTIKDGKPITVECNWVPTDPTHAAIIADGLADTSNAWTIRYQTTGNPEWTFNAFVSDVSSPNLPVDNALPFTFILNPDGVMTFTP